MLAHTVRDILMSQLWLFQYPTKRRISQSVIETTSKRIDSVMKMLDDEYFPDSFRAKKKGTCGSDADNRREPVLHEEPKVEQDLYPELEREPEHMASLK